MNPNHSKPIPIFLFKNPNPPSKITTTTPSIDPYSTLISSENYHPHFIPTLKETYINLETLSKIIQEGPENWEGVIITSKRACESWCLAVRHLINPNDHERDIQWKQRDEGEGVDWSRTNLFTPGQSIIQVFQSSNLPKELIPSLTQNNSGNEAKSANSLLPIILSLPPITQSFSSFTANQKSLVKGHTKPISDSSKYLPYLFLTGDKTLQQLPEGLHQAGRRVIQIKVYETSSSPDIFHEVSEIFGSSHSSTSDFEDCNKGWLAFFSPSSAGFVIPHLRLLGILPKPPDHPDLKDEEETRRPYRIAAIGETTRRYLVDEEHLEVHAVAQTPNPQGLMDAIKRFDQEH